MNRVDHIAEQTTDSSGILLEMRPNGVALEVAAIDEKSGIEVRFQAPRNVPMEAVRNLARQKIRYVLKQQLKNPST